MKKVAVITGGSSGIGFAAATRFAKKGYSVYDLSRGGEDALNITHIKTDVSVEESVRGAFGEVMRREGRVDLLINNAGFGISGAVELTRAEDAKRQFDVNFFGTFYCIKSAIPHLRETKGRIICLSSVAAVLPVPFQSFYSASKAAINALVVALASELHPFGVSVCALMPGDVKTGFTKARRKNRENGLYAGAVERSVSMMEKDEQSGMSPEYIAKQIYRYARKRRVKPLYTIGFKYRIFTFLAKIVPIRFANYIERKLYT